MKSIKIKYIVLAALLTACQDDWLEVRQNKEQVVPQTLDDLQALLDNTSVMNQNFCYLGELSTTDLSLDYEWWLRAILVNQNAYIWKKEVYEGSEVLDWNLNYERIFYANTVLSILADMPDSEQRNQIWGSALFFRAYTYHKLAQIFCKPYDPATAATDLGMPLQLEANINEPVIRSTVAETYQQVLDDLEKAINLLPESTAFTTQPAKSAAYALYAKTQLLMGNYETAAIYAAKSLELKSTLTDFRTIDAEADYPLQNAAEVIFYGELTTVFPIADYSYYDINSDLINVYEEGDLRKDVYFRAEEGGFNGSYCGRAFFGGIGTSELYLIRAECEARRNNIDQALADLNTLRENRYTEEAFAPVVAATPEEALAKVLQERKKELVFRGLHWEDLRRLNKDSRFARTLTRTLDGKSYQLPPNDSRYVFPIPDQVIQSSGIQQNQR